MVTSITEFDTNTSRQIELHINLYMFMFVLVSAKMTTIPASPPARRQSASSQE